MTEGGTEKVTNSEKTGSKSRDRSHKWDKVKVLRKVVVRRLPPSMTEDIFLKQIEPLPEHDSYYFVPADWSLGQDATARAYINFVNQDDIFLFKDRFDGYVFVDSKGAEYPAVVEFAPFQGLPRNKTRKKDPKVNTIETDQHYISFLEALSKAEAEGNKAEFKLEYSFQLKDDKKITSTPLLQYLANKKQERRDERKRKLEEKRRQREEERTRKKNQVTKSIPQAIAEEDTKDDEKPKEKPTDKKRDNDKPSDDRKESRNRRRDQKRREERERKAQENRNTLTATKSETNAREDEDKRKKESKKYSLSRREKQRSREEIRRAESTPNIEQKLKDSITSQSSTISIQSATPSSTDKTATAITTDDISDNVKEFIASCKEFVPRNKTTVSASTLKENTDDSLADVKMKLQQLSCSSKPNNSGKDNRVSRKDSTGKMAGKDEESNSNGGDKRKDEKNVRRIRNKDRPSIEIYQPRRMRLSTSANKDESGRSSTEMKDYKSNPTSDCESIKQKDEKTNIKKKVSRYSERRSGRAKERLPKDTDDKDDNPADITTRQTEDASQ